MAAKKPTNEHNKRVRPQRRTVTFVTASFLPSEAEALSAFLANAFESSPDAADREVRSAAGEVRRAMSAHGHTPPALF